MTSFKNSLFASSLLIISLIADVEAATTAGASIKVAIIFPPGSAGLGVAKTLPSSTKISPCVERTKVDNATFSVTYDATNAKSDTATPFNVYVFFYNSDGVNVAADKFYSISNAGMGGGISAMPYANAAAIQSGVVATTLVPYLDGIDNINTGSVTETLFGAAVRLDSLVVGASLNTGTWQLIGILADPATVDFTKPSTWAAWDVAVAMFGMPWQGINGSVATPPTANLSTCL
jgi:hypothetical protein